MTFYRWGIWGAFLTGWTMLLLFPDPAPLIESAVEITPGRRYYIAKALHIACYFLLAVLTGWLRAPQRTRPLLMLIVMAHGALTELGQRELAHRDGNLSDVGFDTLGIVLGFLASWKWWTQPDGPS